MGHAAKTQSMSNMKNTIWGWKKFIGRRFSDEVVRAEKGLFPYQIVEGTNGTVGIQVCSPWTSPAIIL